VDGPIFGKSQGRARKIEVSIDGASVALFEIDPRRRKADDMKTPPVKVKAGQHAFRPAFIQKFEGPIEDAVSEVGETLVDLNEADMGGTTSTDESAHDLALSGPAMVRPRCLQTPGRSKIFTCSPDRGREEIPCAKKIFLRWLARRIAGR